MSLRYYANAPATALAASCSSTATTIQLASVSGLPIQYPYVLIIDKSEATEEVVEVTNASGTTLTIVRGADSSTAFSHATGATVVHGISARDAREANTHINAVGGVHGVTGNLVGLTDAQSLTNKTLGASNIINGFTASKFMEANGSGRLVSGTKTVPTGDVVGTSDNQTLTNKTLGNGVVFSTGGTTPTGGIVMFGGTSAPTGWLLCDGAAVSRGTYAALFAVVGTTFGTGDGTTTFNTPDLRNKLPMGKSGSKALGSTGGDNTPIIVEANLPPHAHSINHNHAAVTSSSAGAHQHALQRSTDVGASGTTIPKGTTTVDATSVAGIASDGDHTHNVDLPNFVGDSGNGAGASTPMDTTPEYVAVNYIIRT